MSTATEIDWQWTDYQAEVRDTLEASEYDLVVLRIGFGGGKSRCGGQWIHRGGMTDRDGSGESLVMAQDYEKGKSTTFNAFFKALPGEDVDPFKDGDPENSPIIENFNKNDKVLRYVTGHVCWLGGADKWSRFAGSEFNRIWCDEVAHYPPTTDLYKLHEMLISRQRTDGGPNTTLWTSTGNGYNQFYDITERRVEPDGEGGERDLTWGDHMKVIVASTEHNRLLPPDALEKIKRQFKGTEKEQQALHGGFASAQGLVYPDFSREYHIVDHERAQALIDGSWRIYGYDAGWDDPRVVLEIGATPYDQFLVYDEYHATGTHVEDAIAWLRTAEKPHGTIYAEHEPSDIKKFKAAGWDAKKAEKSVDAGISEVRRRLKHDANDRVGLLVSDRCEHTIREFLSYKEEHVGKSVAEDHCVDALRYAVFTNENTTPFASATAEL